MTATSVKSTPRRPRLRRSDCSGPGLRRARRGRGFVYLDQRGRRITDPEEILRLKALAIPPATVRTRLFRARALLRQALERDMDVAAVDVFGFAGERCDRIVAGVLARVLAVAPGSPSTI